MMRRLILRFRFVVAVNMLDANRSSATGEERLDRAYIFQTAMHWSAVAIESCVRAALREANYLAKLIRRSVCGVGIATPE